MFRWKAALGLAAIAVTALVVSSCSSSTETPSDGSANAERLTITTTVTPPSYNPAEGVDWEYGRAYYEAVFDTLLSADAEGEVQPWLATEWSYNEDNTELTLTLRDDVTFTDGEKFTADVAVQSLEQFRDGTSTNASNLEGADFSAADDTTLVITLEEPDPGLLSALSQDAGLIESPSTWTNENASTEPVGSGPYILDAAATVSGSTYAYTKNDEYWNPDAVHYDALTINLLQDPNAIVNSAKAGEANGSIFTQAATVEQFEAAGWTVETKEKNINGLWLIDRDGELTPALADVRVRQAINYAFDREAMLEATYSGLGTVTTQVFPESSVGYDASLDEYYTYDPEKAKELLAEAGYASGLTIEVSYSVVSAATYELIQQQLADIGITVTFNDSAAPGDFTPIQSGKFSMFWLPLGQSNDWDVISSMIAPNATWNPFHTEDATVEDLISTIRTGGDAADAAVGELNTYMVEEAWFAPLFRQKSLFAVDENTTVTMSAMTDFPPLLSFAPKN